MINEISIDIRDFPDIDFSGEGEWICVVHYDSLNVINDIIGAFMVNAVETTGFKSTVKGDYAYTFIRAQKIPDLIIAVLEKDEDILKVKRI